MLSRLDFQRKAVELFQQRGFSSVSMRELAAYVGISPGSIYHHIESKETLLYELLFELYQALIGHLDSVKRRKLDATQTLDRLIEGHLRLHEKMPGHFKLAVMDHGQLSAPLAADIDLLRCRYQQEMLSLFGRGCSNPSGSLREEGFMALFALLNALPGWLNPQLDNAQRNVIARSLINGALQGAKSLA